MSVFESIRNWFLKSSKKEKEKVLKNKERYERWVNEHKELKKPS